MNPYTFNCFLLYGFVIVISLFQSRFRIIKENPVVFILFVIITPFIVISKVKRELTWNEVSGLEVCVYTLLIAFMFPKDLFPKINEGYIYAYTLLHWYFLVDNIYHGFGTKLLLFFVAAISVYPTFLIVKHVFLHQKLKRNEKIALFYWFVFCVLFTYADQFAIGIVEPVLTLDEVSLYSTLILFISAIQVYFLAAFMAFVILAIPLFHIDRGSRPFKERWSDAIKEHRRHLRYKLIHYVEYQVSLYHVILITLLSFSFFFFDMLYDIRQHLIAFYTFVFPILFFYLKITPVSNLDVKPKSNL